MKIINTIVFFAVFTMSLIANESKIQVFQPPASSCPKSWFSDMGKIFDKVEIVTLMSVKNLKKDIGIPKEIQSCNTSLTNDYVFEGNVPARAIKDFLERKPKNAIGLALPSYENSKDEKKVFLLLENSTYKLFGLY